MDPILGRLPTRQPGPARPAAEPPSGCDLAAPLICRLGSRTLCLRGEPRIGSEAFDSSLAARRVLDLLQAKGPAAFERLRGPFAAVLIDADSNEALLAVDRMGIETLAWSATADGLTFGTSAAAVAKHGGARPVLNRQSLFNFMLSHMVGAPDTAFADVNRLVPGTYLRFERGRVELGRYWYPSFQRARAVELDELRGRVLPIIGQAIEGFGASGGSGTFLSGGLDSSTVTGLLARRSAGPVDAFSVAFGVDEFNELEYAKIASEAFGCRHHVYEVVPDDVVELIPRVAAAYDQPFGNSSAVPTHCCARFAKESGVDHLLAGDGGDELFGGNERYRRHQVFELYKRLPRWLRTTLTDPAAERLDPERSPMPLRKFSSYVRQARIPLPDRFESWNLIYREGPEAVFDAEFLETVDTDHPLRRMREVWESCPSDDLLDRMLWYDWKFTLADSDLPKVTRMCELAGVRVSFPMLDEELVELSTRIPSHAKIAGSDLRTFFKEAARPLLPEPILRKKKHGFGLPFGVWLKASKSLQELVYDDLESLSARRILDSRFIRRVLEEHRTGHASYYGYAIWDMVMLEEWLSRHFERAP